VANGLQGLLKSEGELAALHDQGEAGVDVLGCLLLLLVGNHLCLK